MTAAIVDETFGGLLLALRQAGALPFWGPAFTASLEVAYKAVRLVHLQELWMPGVSQDGQPSSMGRAASSQACHLLKLLVWSQSLRRTR